MIVKVMMVEMSIIFEASRFVIRVMLNGVG